MPIKRIYKEEVVILEVDTDLIGYQARVFQDFCKELMAEGVKQLVLNLQEVKSIDSLGTNEICRIIEKGVDVRLINVSHSVNLFFNCNAPNLLERRCSSEEEAIQHIREKSLTPTAEWVEKRQFHRRNINFPVFFNWMEADASNEEVAGVALNLSGGGLLLNPLQADYSLSPAWQKLSIRLLIPELSEPIQAKCQLTRSISQDRQWQMGVNFTQIKDTDRNRIVDYIYNGVEPV